jgi:hypothetical protein
MSRTSHVRPLRRFFLLAVGLLVVGWLALLSPPAHGQKKKAAEAHQKGTQAFRRILHLLDKQPLKSLNELREVNPRKTIIIVFGDLDILGKLEAILSRRQGRSSLLDFVREGGALLIATDRFDHTGWLRGHFNLFLQGDPVVVMPGQEQLAYKRKRECPLVTEFAEPDHAIFRDVKRIATDRPSHFFGLLDPGHFLRRLARFSPQCASENAPFQALQPHENTYVMGGTLGKGRMLLLAGHGVFLNSMMVNQGNDLFAWNCVEWLAEGEPKRTNVLFLEEGQVYGKFNVPLTPTPGGRTPTDQIINQALKGLENENWFNRLLFMLVPRSLILKIVLIAASIALVFYILRRLRLACHAQEPSVPLVATSVAQTEQETVLAQRERAMLLEGNLWEALRAQARECFLSYTGSAAVPVPPAPRIEISRRLLQAGGLRAQVRRLWELAYGDKTEVITPLEFDRLLVLIDKIKRDLARGFVRLLPPQRTGPPTKPKSKVIPVPA